MKTLKIFGVVFIGIILFIVVRGFQLEGFFGDPFVIGFFSVLVTGIGAIIIGQSMKFSKAKKYRKDDKNNL